MLKVTSERKRGLFDANTFRSSKSVILTSFVIEVTSFTTNGKQKSQIVPFSA